MGTAMGTLGDRTFAQRLVAEAQAGREAVLCTILATKGSAPRHAGARMALLQSGERLGTVGGGRIEMIAEALGTGLLTRSSGELVTAGCETAAGALEWIESRTVGMLCGGTALVGVRVLRPEDVDVLRRLAEGAAGATLCEDWSNAAAPRWWVEECGGNAPAAASGRAAGIVWDDERRAYREPLRPSARVLVFGGGHVASALVPLLAGVGFSVVVLEARPALADAGRFPDANEVMLCDYRRLGDAVAVGKGDYAIVMTHEHALDVEVLAQVVPCDPRYVGCMGSMRKAARIREILMARDVPTSLVDAVRIPIGDPIDAETPAEIAVSIAAELIRHRAARR